MLRLLDLGVAYCVKYGYATREQAPWLRYALEKRVASFLVAIPFLILGIIVSSPATAISYYIGFCLLRKRTNGIHAKTVTGCFCASLLSEFFILGVLLPIVDDKIIILLLLLSTLIILILGPYNHPNMHLSDDEIRKCTKDSKIRLTALFLVIALTYATGHYQIANGLSFGVVMVGITLAAAYIMSKGEKHDEKAKQPTEWLYEKAGRQDGGT